MPGPLISILCPTRQRADLFKDSIASLLRADQTHVIEVVVRRDHDDKHVYPDEYVIGRAAGVYDACKLVEVRGMGGGYSALHTYYNDCARAASGRWLVIWNDDCLMRTSLWDHVLLERDPDRTWMVNAHGHFPTVSRRWFEAVGRHISMSPHADTYLTTVGDMLADAAQPGLVEKLREPNEGAWAWDIHHRCDELDDAGSARRKAEILGPLGTSAKFFEPEMQTHMRNDADAIIRAARGLT